MTDHANPKKSWEAACRHFFRHVNDLRELRRNPIFQALALDESQDDGIVAERLILDAVKRRIVDALAAVTRTFAGGRDVERAQRYRAIVEKHIFAGTRAELVAYELHLSKREFYRQKHAACHSIATAMKDSASPRTSQGTSVRLDAGRLTVQEARRLMEGCHYALSCERLEDVLRDGQSAERQIEVLCLISEIYALQRLDEQAAAAYDRARRVFGERWGTGDLLSEAELHLAAARIAVISCDFAQASQLVDRTMELLLPSLAGGEERAIKLYANAANTGGFLGSATGEYTASLSYFRRAIAALQVIPEDLAKRAVGLYGMATSSIHLGTTTVAQFHEMTDPVLELAQRNGLTRLAIAIAMNRALFDAQSTSEYTKACDELTECWRAAIRTNDRPIITGVGLTMASLALNVDVPRQSAVLLGRVQMACKVLDKTEEIGVVDGVSLAHVTFMKAQAQFELMRFREAATAAKRAFANARQLHIRRLEGASLRIIAECYWAQGNQRKAGRAVAEAVALLESAGHARSLADAYRSSAKITGNAAHGRLAATMNARA
jgi:tetratricopeptide (TPR) repeat protein